MKNQNIFVSIAIIVAAVGLGIWLGHLSVKAPNANGTSATDATTETGDKSYQLACDAGKALVITFHLPQDLTLDVATDDGRDLTLNNTSTSATASYSSPDGKTVLALAGSKISLTENGTETYMNCDLIAIAGKSN